jgi:hypothetical protein
LHCSQDMRPVSIKMIVPVLNLLLYPPVQRDRRLFIVDSVRHHMPRRRA